MGCHERREAMLSTLEHQLNDRLEKIEAALNQLLEQRTVKENYTTVEIAAMLKRSDYTVREWCRKGQIPAQKTTNGREWIVSHETLVRLKNRELPLPEYSVALDRRGKAVAPARKRVGS
jgi:excisionase family DNA binding protein